MKKTLCVLLVCFLQAFLCMGVSAGTASEAGLYDDPDRQLVIVYLTNRINSPVTDNQENADQFDGNWYTAGSLGFVSQILSVGMDSDQDITDQLEDLKEEMALEALRLIPENEDPDSDHPASKNARSKQQLAGQ